MLDLGLDMCLGRFDQIFQSAIMVSGSTRSLPGRIATLNSPSPPARNVDDPLSRPVHLPGGLMEQSNASLQRGGQSDVRRRMGPPQRQCVAKILLELGIHVITQGLLEDTLRASQSSVLSTPTALVIP
jgi:hypothetical protein